MMNIEPAALNADLYRACSKRLWLHSRQLSFNPKL
jgi:hypothetical protein